MPPGSVRTPRDRDHATLGCQGEVGHDVAQVPRGREERVHVAPGGAAIRRALVEDAVIGLAWAGSRMHEV